MKAEEYRIKYNEIVKDINAQLKKLKKHDPESVTLEKYSGYFKKATTKNPHYNTIRRLYSSAKKVLESGVLSIEAQERSVANAIDTLHADGYTFINRKNFNSFMRFLDDARSRGLGSLYSSEQILERINEAKKSGLTEAEIKENIKLWSEEINRDKDGKMIEVINPRTLTILNKG